MKPKYLFLTHRVPYPPNRGDRVRSWQVLQYLAERGEVFLATTADEPVSTETHTRLNSLCREVAIAPLGRWQRWGRALPTLIQGRSLSEGLFWQPKLGRTLRNWQQQHTFTAAVVFCSSMFPYVDQPCWEATPRWVDLVDVDSQKWSDYATSTRGWKRKIYEREARCVGQLERRIVEAADRISLTTGCEASLLRQRCPASQPVVMNNGVEIPAAELRDSAPIAGRLAFVGMLDYLPNVTGITWFVQQVWPALRQTLPHVTLEIVGRRPTASVSQLSAVPGVQVTTDVASVQPHIAAAEVVISPLMIARGVQNKVLEALAMRRAVVTTPAVCRGLSVTPGQQLLAASSTEEWLSCLSTLLQNASQRAAIGSAGWDYVSRHHDWQQCLEPLGVWLKEVSTTTTSATALDRDERLPATSHREEMVNAP